jgi:hypothetical protein
MGRHPGSYARGGYHDIDEGPTPDLLVMHRDNPEIREAFTPAVDKRPLEELFDIKKDPIPLALTT